MTLAKADYRDVLGGLVEAYETERDPEPVIPAAEMLWHLIESKGVTQATVAAETGVGESTLCEVLKGKRAISRKAMRSLADYSRVDTSVFF